MRRTIVGSLIGLILGVALGWYVSVFRDRERVTSSRLSPDEIVRASVVEIVPFLGLERSFIIRLEDLKARSSTTLYRSAEEGEPAGSERLIWSKDGTKLLVVGRHFFVQDDLFLDNGDQAYYLYDRPTGQSWINSNSWPERPRLTAGMIQGIEFMEPVILKPR